MAADVNTNVAPAAPKLTSINGLGRWCVGVLWVFVVADLLIGAHNILAYRFYLRLEDPNGFATDAELMAVANSVDNYGLVVGLFFLAMLVLAYVLNGIWIVRAAGNAAKLDPHEGRISSGWALGWFFVPIANLFKPYAAMRQTWVTSVDGPGSMDNPAPVFMRWWWAMWIIAGTTSQISYRISDTDDLEVLRNVALLDLAILPVSIAAAVLFIKIITGVSNAQTRHINSVNTPKEEAFDHDQV